MPDMTGFDANSAVDPTAALVAALRQGDAPAAGRLLAERFQEAMRRFCWGYLGSQPDVEDAVQDIFLKVCAARQAPDHFRAWLYRVARNHCLNLRRGRVRRRDTRPLPGGGAWAATWAGQLTRLARREQRSQVFHLLAALPEEYREALRLRYVEELSRAEVAAVLEIPESLVKTRLYEALRRLREHTSLLE